MGFKMAVLFSFIIGYIILHHLFLETRVEFIAVTTVVGRVIGGNCKSTAVTWTGAQFFESEWFSVSEFSESTAFVFALLLPRINQNKNHSKRIDVKYMNETKYHRTYNNNVLPALLQLPCTHRLIVSRMGVGGGPSNLLWGSSIA